jgi:hypothetical protein
VGKAVLAVVDVLLLMLLWCKEVKDLWGVVVTSDFY